ncbi:MAG TPA: beta-ketoacyl synthase N-terminal-like domain-containing protein, partial [bacterium]|nr:beta-ketoacyl synthase N-terminal-like domain-containing protein [bacterium]
MTPSRIGVFGWGIVAPKSPTIDAFAANLDSAESWLEPFDGFGPDNFLVGRPLFDFEDYRDWITDRFPPRRYQQVAEKMDASTKFAVGSFIQALSQNEGLEQELTSLGTQAHVYVGTGLGSLPTICEQTLKLHRAQIRWNRFWSHPDRNAEMRAWLASNDDERAARTEVPPHPATVDDETRDEAEEAWHAWWMERSPELQGFLEAYRKIEGVRVEGDVETGKLRVIRAKRRAITKLLEDWNAPEPPWTQVLADTIWNIPNTPAAQISMLGRITGAAFAPVAACSTFGVCLKLGMDAIRRGEAKAVVVGATDPPPVPLSVAAFYAARVISADAEVSKPLSELRGTHVAGGAVIWILGDMEYMTQRGFRPLGMEPVSVAVTSDADHIITPTKEGSSAAIRTALAGAGASASDVSTWDLHATATPGDYTEVENLRELLPDGVVVTARKGTFGHGMSAGGGWELTAQYLGYQRGQLFPTVLHRDELNSEIARIHDGFVFDTACASPPAGVAGKLSMG